MRAEIANNAPSNLFVRVNCANSADQAMMGMDTLYPAKNKWTESFYEKSKTAALFIQAELIKSCRIEDLGILERHDLPAFNWSKVPVVEAEVGFMTNQRDDSLLSDDQFRWKVAWGLRNGIIKYLNNP
jgi:N-acetylmuramoyl-L-alanine amidase